MKEKNFTALEIGRMYERRDGLKAIVYGYDVVNQLYKCIVLNTGDFFTVYEDGKFRMTGEDHNDLVYDLRNN